MTNNKDMFKLSRKVAVISVIAVAAIICMSCSFWEDYRIISDSQYYTGNQIEKAFHDNEAQFTEVAEIVFDSKAVTKSMLDSDRMREWIESKTDSKYFTEVEWSKITEFFKKVKPIRIELFGGQYGSPVIGILFPQRLIPGKSIGQHTDLYYIPVERDISVANRLIGQYDTFRKIGEYWWLGEELDCNASTHLDANNAYYENGEWHN